MSFLGMGSPQLIDTGSMPQLPAYQPIWNPSEGLQGQMQNMLSMDPTQYNTQPLQQLQQNAESTAPSPWAQLQSQLARNQTAQGMSQAAGQTAGSTAQAEGNLAMGGGLSSGATERAQTAGEQAGIGAQQGVQNAGTSNLLNIGSQDAAMKQQEQMALPGMETQAYQTSLEPIQMMGQAGAQDVAANMANEQALNQYNMGAYGNEMAAYGAGNTANAQMTQSSNSGGLFGGGGPLGLGSWLCSERNKTNKLTEEEKIRLNELRRHGRKYDPDLTKWYLKNGTTLVTLMKASGKDWQTENNAFIDFILSLLKDEKYEEARLIYRKQVYALCDKYWPRLNLGVA